MRPRYENSAGWLRNVFFHRPFRFYQTWGLILAAGSVAACLIRPISFLWGVFFAMVAVLDLVFLACVRKKTASFVMRNLLWSGVCHAHCSLLCFFSACRILWGENALSTVWCRKLGVGICILTVAVAWGVRYMLLCRRHPIKEHWFGYRMGFVELGIWCTLLLLMAVVDAVYTSRLAYPYRVWFYVPYFMLAQAAESGKNALVLFKALLLVRHPDRRVIESELEKRNLITSKQQGSE
ncbi:MAG: hypothetical protein IJ412_05485 [Oscillospiraceae bacterium]|nr:hypothetical protein [Oscillospiraceae bacterium]